MTLTDISRMLKVAKVPRSKTVQCGYPNPFIDVHVPGTHYPVVMEVVRQMALPTDNIRVSLLTSRDVRESEHVYVKVKGDVVQFNAGAPYDDPGMPANEVRRRRIRSTRKRNCDVIVECASVIAL
jgi:hypothetical protein